MGSSTEDVENLARIVADACHRPLDDWLTEAPAEERPNAIQFASVASTAVRAGDYFDAWRQPESIWALVPPQGAREAASRLARADLNRLLDALEPEGHPVQTFVLAPELADEHDIELGVRWVKSARSTALAALGAIRLLRVLGRSWAVVRSGPSSVTDPGTRKTEFESWVQSFGQALAARARDDEIALWWMVLASPTAVARVGLRTEAEHDFVEALLREAGANLRRHPAENVLPSEGLRKKLTEDGTAWAAVLPILAATAKRSEQDAFLDAFQRDFARRLDPEVIGEHLTGTVEDLLYLQGAGRALATVALRGDWRTSWSFGEFATLAESWSYWDQPSGRGGLHRQVVLSWVASEGVRLLGASRPDGWREPANLLFDAVNRRFRPLMLATDNTSWPRSSLPAMLALAGVAIDIPELGERLLALCELADDLRTAEAVQEIGAGKLTDEQSRLLGEAIERRRVEATELEGVDGHRPGRVRQCD